MEVSGLTSDLGVSLSACQHVSLSACQPVSLSACQPVRFSAFQYLESWFVQHMRYAPVAQCGKFRKTATGGSLPI